MRFCLAGKQFWTWSGVLGLLISVCLATTAEPATPFDEANRFYEQGKYAEAIERYESMVKAGRNSPGVYFNLGNAYFKQGELGRALLNYRKAEALAPRDPDIQANLRFARERVSGSFSIERQVWERAVNYFTLNELAGAASLLFWLWAGLYCISRWRPAVAASLRMATLTSGTLLLLSIVVIAVAAVEERKRVAIVISKQATVHLGPLTDSQSAFVATDGSELRVMAQRAGWLQVSDRAGRTGWLSEADAIVY